MSAVNEIVTEIPAFGENGGPYGDKVALVYNPDEPFDVHLVFDGGRHGHVVWRFARDLLICGMESAAGLADVLVFLAGPCRVAVTLSSPDGTSTIFFPREDVRQFVDRTLDAVPAGSEPTDFDADSAVDFDAELFLLLEDGAR